MDSLANYGSDDECEENSREKLGTMNSGRSDGSRYYSPEEADANYDEVQMDLSEESNNNNSNEEDDRIDRRNERTSDKRRRDRSRSKDDQRTTDHRSFDRSSDSKSSELRSNDQKSNDFKSCDQRSSDSRSFDQRSEKSSRHKDNYRSRSKYEGKPERSGPVDKHSSPKSRDDQSGKDRSKRHRRSGSKEKKRSTSRDRKRSNSKEMKRSRSKERKRSRSPRRSEFRKRSNSQERDRGNRYGKRFDRTSNKMAQLEKLGIEIKTPDAEFVTPQMLLQRSMDEQVQKVKNSTGIELPKYYNPTAMNPARYADQIQKRRLLWQKKEMPETEVNKKPDNTMGKVWEGTTFAQDSDGKVASKFKRLMGIKEPAPSATKDSNKDILKKQEEMFSSMEQQYEVARTATHTMRGVGLGFGSFQYPR